MTTNLTIEIGGSLAELSDAGQWFSDNDRLTIALKEYSEASLALCPYNIYHPNPAVQLALWVISVFGGRIINYPEEPDLPEGAIG